MTIRGRSNSASGIRGVHYEADRDRWCGEIRVTVKGRVVRERRRFPGNRHGKLQAAAWVTSRRRELGVE